MSSSSFSFHIHRLAPRNYLPSQQSALSASNQSTAFLFLLLSFSSQVGCSVDFTIQAQPAFGHSWLQPQWDDSVWRAGEGISSVLGCSLTTPSSPSSLLGISSSTPINASLVDSWNPVKVTISPSAHSRDSAKIRSASAFRFQLCEFQSQ